MNRAQAKRHIKASTYTPKIGCGPYRKRSKASQSASLERDIENFLAGGGEIKVLDTQRSEFRPTWAAYATASFEDRGDEA